MLSKILLGVLLSIASLQSGFSANHSIIKSPRIVGGSLSAKNFAPWFVGLVDSTVSDNWQAQFCGGTLIHPEWVVTAAHCVFDNNGQLLTVNSIDILTGTHSLFSGGERIKVSQIIPHPNFDTIRLKNDIALLHLVTPINNNKIISLNGISFDLPVVADYANSTVIGWGSVSANSKDPRFPAELEQVDLPIIPESQCRQLMGNDIFSTSLCAGVLEGGKDSCQGDSGGPLISVLSGENQLIGIVSWGNGCAKQYSPGVYTRVSKYEGFITRHICGNEQPNTPVLTLSAQKEVGGGSKVSIHFSTIQGADKYRLYYALYKAGQRYITGIRHIDTYQQLNSYAIPAGMRFYIAGQAVKNNCVSAFSAIAITP